jgi:hypothetical protein
VSVIHPVPPGPWPAGQAWYPLLGTWGPSRSLLPDDWDPSWEEEREPLAPDLWQTKEGKIVRIADLETGHLKNIIRMIEKANGGPGCLVRLHQKNERVRNLLNEWLRRF